MAVQVEKLDKNRVRLVVSVDSQVVGGAFERAYKKLSRRVKVDGFRPGKIPRSVLAHVVGKDSLAQEALEEILLKAYPVAVKEAGIVAIGGPKFPEAPPPEEGSDYAFVAEVETKPEIKLGAYRGVTMPPVAVELPAAEVQKALDSVRARLAKLLPKSEPAEAGDVVFFDLFVEAEGRTVRELSKKDLEAELGVGSVYHQIEYHLLGAQAGEQKSVVIACDEAFPLEALRGRDASLRFTIKEVKKKFLPELDDELAKQAGYGDLQALRRFAKERVRHLLAQRVRDKFLTALVDKVVEPVQVDLPHSLVEAETARILYRLGRNVAAHGLDPAEVFDGGKLKSAADQERVEAIAREKVRKDLVLEAIATQEEITVSTDEFSAEVVHLAQHLRQDPKHVLKQMQEEGEDRLIASQLLREKTVNFLFEQCRIDPGLPPITAEPEDSEAPDPEPAAGEPEPQKGD